MSQSKKLFLLFRRLRSVWCLEFFFWILNRFYIYYMKLLLGFSPRNFMYQMDRGRDVLWVSCASCKGCTQTNKIQVKSLLSFSFGILWSENNVLLCLDIQLDYFDSGSSVTTRLWAGMFNPLINWEAVIFLIINVTVVCFSINQYSIFVIYIIYNI